MEHITEIIKGCINNEHKYQKIVYEHCRGFALKIVFRYIYRYEKALEVVNDGFIKMFNHFHVFVPVDEDEENEKILMGWLKKIMINTAVDSLRRGSLLNEIGGIPGDVFETTDKNDDADRLVLYNDLIVLIKELPPTYRIVFNLYVIDGYTHTEIADILNMSIGTSKSSLSRARALLQKSIKQMEGDKLCRI